jgi:hypothetical protein
MRRSATVVKSSWKRVTYFKSPLRVVINFLSKSRDLKADKYRELKQEFDQSCVELSRVQKRVLECEDELREWKARYYRLESDRYREAQATPIRLPADPPVGRHGYGARMIVLCLMLVRVIGFRSTAKVLQIMFQWLGVKQKIPHFTTMIGWMKRWGVAVQQEGLEKADDWIWKVDHSNQIGQEKVLVVLGVRASKLSAEAPLRHEDLHVIAVRPSKACKREDVAAVYKELAETYGAPRELISDQAVELQESAECLKAFREDIVILQDFKHKAANLLEAAVGKSQGFASFLTHVGTTRSAIPQTEFAHLTPPVLKSKARFMNLGRVSASDQQRIGLHQFEETVPWCGRPNASSDGGKPAACSQSATRRPVDRIRERRRSPPEGRRTPIAKHRDSGIQLCPLQTTGRSTLQRRFHHLNRHVRWTVKNAKP